MSKGCIKFIKSVGEEYIQFGREEGNIKVGRKNIAWKKGGAGRNVLFPLILRLLERISRREEGRGIEKWERKSN